MNVGKYQIRARYLVIAAVLVGIFVIASPKTEPAPDEWFEIVPEMHIGTTEFINAEGSGDGTPHSLIEVSTSTYFRFTLEEPSSEHYDSLQAFIVKEPIYGIVPLNPYLNQTELAEIGITVDSFPAEAMWQASVSKEGSTEPHTTGRVEDFLLAGTDLPYKEPLRLYVVLLSSSAPTDRSAFAYVYDIVIRERDALDFTVTSFFDRQPAKPFLDGFYSILDGLGVSEDIQDSLAQFISLIGVTHLSLGQFAMLVVGLVLIYLAVAKDIEPVLLLPIGFGALLVNLPLAGMMDVYNKEGLLYMLYASGVLTELFPILIFIGIGAMTDFGPLLERPKMLVFGAAGQFGIFFTLMLALILQSTGILPVLREGFALKEASSIAIIGAADGPSAIYLTAEFAPHMIGPVVVAAYSYMALVPLIQRPVMKLLTTEKERKIRMEFSTREISRKTRIMFPIIVALVTSLIAPLATPLIGSLMLGNLLREAGVVDRLRNAAENEIPNTVTLLLGISVGATMNAQSFLTVQTVVILVLGVFAFMSATAAGVILGKIYSVLTGGKLNPLVGACGISAFPMSARVVASVAREADPENFLIYHAMASNTGGQLGSVVATGMLLLLVPYFAPFLG